MAKARPRHIITGAMSANGVDLRGQEVVEMGPCIWTGQMKKRGEKFPTARELDHVLFRLEDKAFLREHKLLQLNTMKIRNDQVGRFLTPKD